MNLFQKYYLYKILKVDDFQIKTEHIFECRLKQYKKLQKDYPNSIYAIIDKGEEQLQTKQKKINSNQPEIGNLPKQKFVLQRSLTSQTLQQYIKTQLKLTPEQSLNIMVQNNLLKQDNCTVEEIYNKCKDEDGFIYFTFFGLLDKG